MLRLYVSVIITFVLETEPEQIILRSDDEWVLLCFSSATILKQTGSMKIKIVTCQSKHYVYHL